MSSAFKNFFITFIVCLLIFGFLGFKFAYPWLSDVVDLTEMGDTSEPEGSVGEGSDPPDESSETVPPVNPDDYNENGDIFRAIVYCVDDTDYAVSIAFISSNAKSKQFIYSPISPSVRLTNEVGVTVSAGDLFGTAEPKAACQIASAMTGLQTDYCIKLDKDGVRTVASLIPGASVSLTETVTFQNPAYDGFVSVEGTPYPDDYYISIANVDGKVNLTDKVAGKTNLDWLLEYNPAQNGGSYNSIYALISKSLLRQFFEQEGSMKSVKNMTKIISASETNLTADAASEHLETIFSYNNFTRHDVNYPSRWESAVAKLRGLDGTK